MTQSQGSRITPLPEHEARDLIQRCYLHGRKVGYYSGENRFAERLFGTVVGVGEKIIERGGFHHKLAGRYLDFTKLRIAPTKGGPEVLCSINNGSVGPMFPFDGPDAAWMTHEEMGLMARILIYSGPLPETPLWEGDVVVQKRVITGDKWTIIEIDYEPTECDEPCYKICSTRHGNVLRNFAGDLTLVSRGNLWKMEHGEPMEFASIEDEAKFYQSLGMSQNVTRIAATEQRELADATEFHDAREEQHFYATITVTFSEAIQALRNCVADEIKIKDQKKMTFILIKYDREEFGRRMRMHTFAKFGITE